MAQHNDSINQNITRPMHDAMHETTMAIIECLKQVGCNVGDKIDFNPSTGEVRMTPRTLKALADFQRELKEKEISIDKIMHADNLAASGYYVHKGRRISAGGVILAEGEVIGFVQVTPVDGVLV